MTETIINFIFGKMPTQLKQAKFHFHSLYRVQTLNLKLRCQIKIRESISQIWIPNKNYAAAVVQLSLSGYAGPLNVKSIFKLIK